MTMTRPIRTLLCISAAILMTACGKQSSSTTTPPAGGTSQPAKKLVVGFAQTGAESEWRRANTVSMTTEAEKRGIEFKFTDAQGKQENQLKAVNSFIAQGVDAIIIAPLVETGWEPVLTAAKKAKIPVILSDRRIKVADDSLFACFIGSDFVEEGRMAGKWLKEKMQGKGAIVELQGTPGSAPAIDRQKGFLEVIKDTPELKVIDTQSGEFTRSKGKEVMEAFLKKHGKNIQALYAHNDDMAIGAIQAIQEAGMKPGTEVIVVSVDAIKDAFVAMTNGTLNCTVECNPLLGPSVFDAVQKVLKGETVPKYSYVKDEAFDQKNAAQRIGERKY